MNNKDLISLTVYVFMYLIFLFVKKAWLFFHKMLQKIIYNSVFITISIYQ